MKYQCKRCGYTWTGRLDTIPKQCPACKSYRWNVAKWTKKEEGKNENRKMD